MDSDGISRRGFVGGSTVAAGLATLASPAPAAGAGRGRTLLAIGGGGFAQAWTKPVLERYLLALSSKPNPKLCWLGPASGESAAGFEAFARMFEPFGATVRHFNIYQPETLDFVDYLMGMDIVFVGGGSTKNLVALWREWSFDQALKAAYAGGVVMSGSSAGMICWYEGGLTDSFPKVLGPVKGIGVRPGSANPHYQIRPDRKSQFRKFIADGTLPSPGLALDEGVAALYRDDRLVEYVTNHAGLGAYLLTRTATGLDEVSLPVRVLT